MDAQVQALLDFMAAQAEATGAPPLSSLSPAEARTAAELAFQAFNSGAPELASIADAAAPGRAGEVPLRIYRPIGNGPFPLLVFIHGGGWVIGSRDTHQKLCAELAAGSGTVVVSVDYRLAPEDPPPAALDDCVTAIRWAVENAPTFGADGSRFAVGGDSAGGNLTAAAVLRLRDEVGPRARLQLLLYGAFDFDLKRASYVANAEGKILTLDAIRYFWGHYLSGGANPADPYISPARGNLHGLPPAHLIVGTLDPLLDDSVEYAQKLEAAGVPVQLSIYPDMPHVFLQLTSMLDGGKRGVAEACEALRKALA